MNKVLLLLSAACLILLTIGTTLFPNYPVFWLASSGSMYEYVRIALSLVLIGQLITRPPRHLFFRLIAGLLAVFVGVWVVEATYSNHMMFLDSMSLMATAFAIAITALEVQSLPTKDSIHLSENEVTYLGSLPLQLAG